MEVQPQLILLQKTLLAIEGLGRELYPELDLWTTAKPVLEDWMAERTSPVTHARRFIDDWPEISEDLIALPSLLHSFVREQERRIKRPMPLRRGQFREQARSGRRMFASAAFLVAGVLWLGLDVDPEILGWVAALGGSAALLITAVRR